MSELVVQELEEVANPEHAVKLQGFFKTGPGEYGEGDVFIGVRVPEQRKVARRHRNLPLSEVSTLLRSGIHEHRQTSLFILVEQYKRGDEGDKEKIVDMYLAHTDYINNWDLVDSSAHKILGEWLLDKQRDILYEFVKSEILWERRISVISTFAFINKGYYDDTLRLCELLLKDDQDLIHKATGWALREIGKKDEKPLLEFLDKHVLEMPRTMLRYSIERLPEVQRQSYLKKK